MRRKSRVFSDLKREVTWLQQDITNMYRTAIDRTTKEVRKKLSKVAHKLGKYVEDEDFMDMLFMTAQQRRNSVRDLEKRLLAAGEAKWRDKHDLENQKQMSYGWNKRSDEQKDEFLLELQKDRKSWDRVLLVFEGLGIKPARKMMKDILVRVSRLRKQEGS